MSTLKLVLAIIVAIPLALLAALLFMLSDADYYREPLEASFREQIGLVLRIEGDIDWRYWPPVALRFADAEIRPEGSDTALAQVRAVAVDLDVWPLLTGSRRVAIRGIAIDGLALNLQVDAKGKGNWEVESAPATGTEAESAADESGTADDGGALALDIRETDFSDLQIHYTDARDGSDYRVAVDSLTTGPVLYDSPTATRFHLVFTDVPGEMQAQMDGDGNITFDAGFSRFAFSDLKLAQQWTITGLPAVQLNLTLNGEYAVDAGTLSTDLSGQMDGAPLLGKASLTLGERTDATFDLVLERFDANRYLAPDTAAAAPEAAGTSAPPEDSEVIPVELLRMLDFTGKLQVRSLVYDTFPLSDFVLDVDNRRERLHATTQVRAYGGEVASVIDLATGRNVTGTAEIDLSGIDLAQFAEVDWITGKASMKSSNRFVGSRLSEILGSLTGDTNFSVDDGTLDVRPIKSLANTIDSLRGKQSSVSEWPDRMPFEKLQGELRLADGIQANQRLGARMPSLTIAGRGGIDYFANHLAYDLEVNLEETTEGPFQVSGDLARIKWPLHCEGALDADPMDLCLPDRKAVQKLIADVAKQEIRDKGKDKILEKLPEGVKDGVEKLKNLFKR